MAEKINKSCGYVFKETEAGLEYVGDFEGLYQNVDDPWGQLYDDYFIRRSFSIIEALKALQPRTVLDVGCGLGQVTQLIQLLITRNVLGIDISKTAIEKAEKRFPTVDFRVMNILKEQLDNKYDTIVVSGILWYILNDLQGVLDKVSNALTYQGHLVIFQTFIEDQRYGKEIIDGYHGWIDYLSKYAGCKLMKTIYYDSGDRRKDSLTVLRRSGNGN